jgi:hypothetical protein
MIKFHHLIWTVIASIGLILSTSQSFAQQTDPGDQPGLLANDSVEVDPEFRRTMVLYRTSERRRGPSSSRHPSAIST